MIAWFSGLVDCTLLPDLSGLVPPWDWPGTAQGYTGYTVYTGRLPGMGGCGSALGGGVGGRAVLWQLWHWGPGTPVPLPSPTTVHWSGLYLGPFCFPGSLVTGSLALFLLSWVPLPLPLR